MNNAENTARDSSEEVDPIEAIIIEEAYQEAELKLTDLDPNSLINDVDRPISASAELSTKPLSQEILQNVNKTIQDLETHETYGMADEDLKKPYSTLGKTPEGMFIKSGNEDGEVVMETKKLELAGFTEAGVGCGQNDDGLLVSGDKGIIAVADGADEKYFNGRIASNVTMHTLARLFSEDEDEPKIEGEKKDEPVITLRDIPSNANSSLHEYHEHNEKEASNCTASFAAVEITPEGTAKLVHVGDAKIYMIRNGRIFYESVDDTMLEVIKTHLGINDAQAKEFVHKTFKEDAKLDGLTQGIGKKEQIVNPDNERGNITTSKIKINPHYKEFQVQPGDVFLVMTGALKTLGRENIKDQIVKGLDDDKPVDQILKIMKEEANTKVKNGEEYPQNLSAGIIKVKES